MVMNYDNYYYTRPECSKLYSKKKIAHNVSVKIHYNYKCVRASVAYLMSV